MGAVEEFIDRRADTETPGILATDHRTDAGAQFVGAQRPGILQRLVKRGPVDLRWEDRSLFGAKHRPQAGGRVVGGADLPIHILDQLLVVHIDQRIAAAGIARPAIQE